MNIMKRIRSTQEGFTLIELLIVIIILGVLAAIIIPRMTNLTERARVSAGESSLRSVHNGLQMYRVEYGEYPTDLSALEGDEGLVKVIENFKTLDEFLGEWTWGDIAVGVETEGYTRTNDSFTINVHHVSDESLELTIDQDGTIERATS